MQLPPWSRRSFVTAAAVLAAAAALYAAVQNYAAARAAMVEDLRQQGIRSERVLAAMGKVPRHAFVADAYRSRAYDPMEVPAPQGDVVCAPYVVALMVQSLDPKPKSKVLEVGTGAGYQTAVLAEMGARVYTVERYREKADAARLRVQSLGYRNVRFGTGDGPQGWQAYAPYDGILVAMAVDRVPPPLLRQLGDGGRLVIPLGRGPEQTLNCISKNGARIRVEVLPRIRMSSALNPPRPK